MPTPLRPPSCPFDTVPDILFRASWPTAAYGLGGETEKAKELAAQVTSLVPTISVRDLEEHFLYYRDEDRHRLATGLRAGGLPE